MNKLEIQLQLGIVMNGSIRPYCLMYLVEADKIKDLAIFIMTAPGIKHKYAKRAIEQVRLGMKYLNKEKELEDFNAIIAQYRHLI